MKKTLLLLLIGLLCLPAAALAETETPEADGAFGKAEPDREILAPYYIVVDASDPSLVFYENEADARCIPGSTQKIMTCILALEMCPDLEETVEVSRRAANLKESNSLMGALEGEQLTIRELLYGLMLESGNDAALTLALHIAGSVEDFALLMNEKAAALDMAGTGYINASGTYKRDQFSTARDMAKLACYALQNETFRQIVSTPRYTIAASDVRKKPLELVNSNLLLSSDADDKHYYEFADGVKTGSTEQGGKCLVASATKDGATVVAVLLGAKEGGSKNARMSRVFLDAKYLLDKALTEEYETVSPGMVDYSDQLAVEGGNGPLSVAAVFDETAARVPAQTADRVRADASLLTFETELTPLVPPIAAGTELGGIRVLYDGQVWFTGTVVAQNDVAAKATVQAEPSATPVPEADKPPAEAKKTPHTTLLIGFLICFVLLVAAVIVLFVMLKRKKTAPADSAVRKKTV